jgi:hypothetical protein
MGRERATLEASLKALGTSYVDLRLVHRPPPRSLVPVWQGNPVQGIKTSLNGHSPGWRHGVSLPWRLSGGGMSDMSAERAETLEVLREVWRSQGQNVADLDDGCEKSCRRMTDAGVGFDDFAGDSDADRTAAWRARLEREGKLNRTGGSLRDLVLGPNA